VPRSFTSQRFAASLILALACAGPLHAQTAHTVTVLMLDGKTGQPIIPSNFIVRFDHLNAIRNDAVTVDDGGVAHVLVPAGATYLAVQGTYDNSMNLYINCDAAMEKNIATLHWYSVADILSTGVAMPNECYKGKYAEATHVALKPGTFVFTVRKNNWHELPPE
jgi:hypothetical protein